MTKFIEEDIYTLMFRKNHTYYFYIILLFFAMSSCKKKSYNKSHYELITSSEIDRLSNIIHKRGDKYVYGQLILDLERVSKLEKIVPLAKVMSDKFNNREAMFDVYDFYPEYRGISSFDELEKEDKKEALNYLIKAYENRHKKSESILKFYDSEGVYIVKTNNSYKIKE